MAAEIFREENAIVLAAAEKMVSLGSKASQRILNGRTCEEQDKQAQTILSLLTAYNQKDNLTTDDVESILYDLRELSEDSAFPTVNPIVGQELVYLVEAETGGSGSLQLLNNYSLLPDRGALNFYGLLKATDDGARINVNIAPGPEGYVIKTVSGVPTWASVSINSGNGTTWNAGSNAVDLGGAMSADVSFSGGKTITNSGLIKYATDLSGSYDARTHIDKGYADATYAPISGSTAYWSLASGGAITGDNTLSGAFGIGFTNWGSGVASTIFLTPNVTLSSSGQSIISLSPTINASSSNAGATSTLLFGNTTTFGVNSGKHQGITFANSVVTGGFTGLTYTGIRYAPTVNSAITHYAVVISSGLVGLGTTTPTSQLHTVQPVGTAAASWTPMLLMTPGAHTGMTASTEFFSRDFAGATQQWATGALTNQRWNYFRGYTAAFVGASTLTNAYTVYIESPVAGTNATITNNYALGINGKVNALGRIDANGGSSTSANLRIASTGQVAAPSGVVSGDVWLNSNGVIIANSGSNSGPIITSITGLTAGRVSFATGATGTYITDSASLTFSTTTGLAVGAGGIAITQSAFSSAWQSALSIAPGANTAMTASTEFAGINVKVSPVTQQWATGVLAVQRWNLIDSPTISFVGASTITDAYNVYINAPIAGTNATITNNWALGVNGRGLFNDQLVLTSTATKAALRIGLIASNPSTTIQGDIWYESSTSVLRFKGASNTILNVMGGIATVAVGSIPFASAVSNQYTSAAGFTYSTTTGLAVAHGGIKVTQAAFSSAWKSALSIAPGANTAMTASTEFAGINFKVNTVSQQWATGALTTQRWNYFTAPTITFVGASTLTNAYNLYVDSPIAGTNATITNNYSIGTGGNVIVGGKLFTTATTTLAAINVGSFAGDPSSPVNGDLTYNSTSNSLRARINGAWVSLGAGGGITNGAANTELMMSDGTNAISSKLFATPATGTFTIGDTGLSGARTIIAQTSDSNSAFNFQGKGAPAFNFYALTAGNITTVSIFDGDFLVSKGGSAATTTSRWQYQKARGNISGYTTVINGDTLGILAFGGYEGTGLHSGVIIKAVSNGTVATGSVPADLIFLTGTGGTGDVNTLERLRIDSVGNLVIKNRTSAPGAFNADSVYLFAEDISASSELRVRDEAGNTTTLSPHNFSLLGGPSEEMAWSYYSEKTTKLGTRRINVDILAVIREVENLTGKKLVFQD